MEDNGAAASRIGRRRLRPVMTNAARRCGVMAPISAAWALTRSGRIGYSSTEHGERLRGEP